MKVLVANSQAEGLQLHLRSMVEGLLKWQDAKSHFKAKVVFIITWHFSCRSINLLLDRFLYA